MAWFRARKGFKFHDIRGKEMAVKAGQLIDVLNRHEATRLTAQGKIRDKQYGHEERIVADSAPSDEACLRVGIWLRSSAHYSGGRLHMYQYAINLALSGAQVFFITTVRPIWADDYPASDNLFIVREDQGEVPQDLDICMTDSKGRLGLKARSYKAQHPRCRFVCLNFETANWVEQYVPRVAKNMARTHLRQGYEAADLLLGNSGLSAKYLAEWMGGDGKGRYGVLPPAINTYALAQERKTQQQAPERPYAVWSARNTDFKCSDLAIDSIWRLDIPFDLVTFGDPGREIRKTSLHEWHNLKNFNDRTKYHMLANARMVLAPSLFEGFGMVPGEALASGTPCIVYDLPILRQVYGDRLIYVPWKRPHLFSMKVEEVARAPKPQLTKESRWVKRRYGMEAMRQRIERLPWHAVERRSVTACMICYATPTALQALEAVEPHVDQLLVAYGAVGEWDGFSDGGMQAKIAAWCAAHPKATMETRRDWTDKIAMRQWLADRIEGNYQLVLDADEIWVGLDRWLAQEKDKIAFAVPRWVNLWHGGDHWIHDAASKGGHRWGSALDYGSVCPHYRFSWWRPTYRWAVHHTPEAATGDRLHALAWNDAAARRCPEVAIYHLGHAMSEHFMRQKHAFYERRDGAPSQRAKAWLDWKGKIGDCGDGVISARSWPLPAIVKEALAACRL